MDTILSLNALFSIFYYFAFWFQPAFWMWFYNYKAPRLNSLKFLFPASSTVAALSLILPSFSALYEDYPMFYLMGFYSMIGLFFAYILSTKYNWGFTHALSIGALTAFAGSYLWEVPYIIRNAPATGLGDWAYHLFGFLIVWAIGFYVGWVSLLKALPLLLLSLTVSFACMVIYPITSPAPGDWNVPLYMFNRGVGCVVSFMLIKKTPR